MRRRRQTAGVLHESQVLARGAAHVLEVLKTWHPDSDEARLALKCVLDFEATLTERAQRWRAPETTTPPPERPHAPGRC